MNKTIGWVVAAVMVLAAGGVYYYVKRTDSVPVSEMTLPVPEGAQEAVESSEVQHPLAVDSPDTPLPALEESDAGMQAALSEAVGAGAVSEFLVPQNIIRRFVITVDNLSRQKVAVQMRPVKPTGGMLAVTGNSDAGERVVLSPENAARYAPFVRAVQALDMEQAVGVYRRFYPLFQKAYEDLGYPGKYFNDRLVQAIDHLLETPEIAGEIELVRPKVFYEFKDPALEARSAGQKLLIRMGAENAAAIKTKLRELRAVVAKSAPASAAPVAPAAVPTP